VVLKLIEQESARICGKEVCTGWGCGTRRQSDQGGGKGLVGAGRRKAGSGYSDHISTGKLRADKVEPFGLLVWNTGLAANPLMAKLKGISHDEKTQSYVSPPPLDQPAIPGRADHSRIHVSPYLQPLTEGVDPQPIPNVFAIGDNALPLRGGRLPATAQVASQMASWVSKTLKYTGKGGQMEDKPAFVWKNRGSMVFVGDYRVRLSSQLLRALSRRVSETMHEAYAQALVDRSSKTIEGIKSRLSGSVVFLPSIDVLLC
jgi:NADH dehydrogenase